MCPQFCGGVSIKLLYADIVAQSRVAFISISEFSWFNWFNAAGSGWFGPFTKAQKPNIAAILSLALSCFLTTLKFGELMRFIFIWARTEEIAKLAKNDYQPESEEKARKFEAKLRSFRWRAIVGIGSFVLLALALSTALFTLMGAGRCPHGILTLHGCISVPTAVFHN